MRDGLLPRILDWPAFLEAWGRKARARRRKGAPTVITTFAGAGGSSCGYRMAGFRVLAATDFWERSAETYRANWPKAKYLVADITQLDPVELMDLAGIGPDELDILDGSPPCQGFSLAGKRQLDDPRNSLFLDFCRLLDGIKPKTFVMENVGGLIGGRMRTLFREMTVALASEGYEVSCRMIDASWLSVPQRRRRLIWIGIRRDLEVSSAHPIPMYGAVSVREALTDLTKAEATASPFTRKEWNELQNVGLEHSGWRSARKPLQTTPAIRSPLVLTNENERKGRTMTEREIARLHSFPDFYEFKGNKSEVQRQLGNAVPPLMMAHIAAAIGERVLGFPARYIDPMKA